MPQVNIFRWRAGSGWLVLSGGGSWQSGDVLDIEARMLGCTLSQGPIAYIWAAGDIEAADHHMDALRDLGARTGYLVDILTESDDVLFQRLSEAGVIILGGGVQQQVLRDALVGVALRGLEEAFDRGATIYAVGESAAVLGAFVGTDNLTADGFHWLAGAIIMAGYTAEQADHLRTRVHKHPDSYGLGLGEGAALALGPRGEVETWGNRAITVSLGQQYGPGDESYGAR
jgi:peptidase E